MTLGRVEPKGIDCVDTSDQSRKLEDQFSHDWCALASCRSIWIKRHRPPVLVDYVCTLRNQTVLTADLFRKCAPDAVDKVADRNMPVIELRKYAAVICFPNVASPKGYLHLNHQGCAYEAITRKILDLRP